MILTLDKGHEQDIEYLTERIVEQSDELKVVLPSETGNNICRVIRNDQNEIIAGGIGTTGDHEAGYIESLWVKEGYRHRGFGTIILDRLEGDLRLSGCRHTHVKIFDFQAPTFFKEKGYYEIGKVEHDKSDLTEYYFAKKISNA